jgi:hypothetical protein
MSSFVGKVKLLAPCHKILWHVKITWKVQTKILHKAKFIISFTCPSCLLLDDSAGRIVQELWWTNQDFPFVDMIPPWFSISSGSRKQEIA